MNGIGETRFSHFTDRLFNIVIIQNVYMFELVDKSNFEI